MTFRKIVKVGGRSYLYERESYWDPATKRSKQRNVRYLGRCDAEGNLIEPAKPRMEAPHAAFPVGALSVFYATAQRFDLSRHVRESLGVEDLVASHVLCLVLNQLTGHRPLEKLPRWMECTPIPEWEGIDAASVTRDTFEDALHALCHVTREGATEDLGLALQRDLTQAWRAGSREPAEYYYDVTRQIYHGTSCDLAEPGYYPGGTHKRVLGFGLVTSKTHHHPVLCRAIPGSRNDTVTVQDTVQTLQAFDLKHLTLIIDRGMVSAENVKHILNNGYHQLGMVPETHKSAWDYITRWPREELEQPRYVVERDSKRTVYARAWTASLMGQPQMRVAVVVDPIRKADEQITRDALVSASEHTTDAKQLRDIRDELGPLTKTVHGRRGWTVDEERVKEDRKGDGRFLMFSTNTSMSAEDMVLAYYRRDTVEKAFRCIKGELTLGPIRYRRKEKIDAYTTIVYMAYLLWTLAERRLKEKFPTMSLHQALDLVENVNLVRFGVGKQAHEWTTRLSDEQAKVLKHLGASKHLPVA